jgi:glyoxylase-like metal-dependent hydrolase (beta-lactamase superfamily II)
MTPTIDTLDLAFRGRPQVIGAFLVRAGRGAVLVETGPASTLPNLVAGLAEHGLTPDDVTNVLLTHIHLDHAGAAGWWAERGATVWVHPRGAPHLVDPSKLEASARRIYGELMDSLWGPITPAPPQRVRTVEDGEAIEVEGLRFTAIDTPGHANHHHVYRLGDVAFTGDVAAIRLHGTGGVDLPAPPPEFDLEKWRASLDRLRAAGLERIYRTHFGAADGVAAELDAVEALLEETTAVVRAMIDRGLDRASMLEEYRGWVRRRAAAAGADADVIRAYETANPREMSVDGIVRYWRKRADG